MGEDSKETRSQEQRVWSRLECCISVHYRVESEDAFGAGRARDISGGGIKFETRRRIQPPAILWLVIQLPLFTRPIKVRAEVVSVSQTGANGSYEVGVRFLEAGEKVKKQIAHYLEEITYSLRGMERPGLDGLDSLSHTQEAPGLLHEEGASPSPADMQMKEEKKKEGPDISALVREIEALEMIINEEKEICQLGELATLSFHSLSGCPPLMLGLKFEEAVKESILRKHGLSKGEINEVLEGCKKKFRALGTKYYVKAFKREM